MKALTVSGVSLFRIAVQEMGDVGEWVRIAQQNRLFDPVISGVATISIPDRGEAASRGLPD